MTSTFPKVEFDRTLFDLHSLDGGDPSKNAHVIAIAPPFDTDWPSLPRNKKYTFQAPTAPKLDPDTYARICLGDAAQNHGFVSGPMPLYLFDIGEPEQQPPSDGSLPTHQEDARRVYDAIVPSQRPNLSFIANPASFKPDAGVEITPYPPLDFLDNHPCISTQETHYHLLSKRGLALSGLPTPKTLVIDGKLSPADLTNDDAVEAESQRIVQAVRDSSLPFVIKFPQSLSGLGVFVVKDEERKANYIRILEAEVPRMVSSMTSENAHMNPVSLLVQDMVAGDTHNVAIFVTRTGRPVFVSCAEQFLNDAGHWHGSILDYKRQSEFEDRFKGIVGKLAAYVHKHGFYGAMGGDIMTDKDGNQHIVDMNIRIPGDYMMGPLSGHFYERRGLRYSYIIAHLAVPGNRDGFEARFKDHLMDGKMIIIGWCRGKAGKAEYSICSLIVGGTEQAELMDWVEEIKSIGLKMPTVI